MHIGPGDESPDSDCGTQTLVLLFQYKCIAIGDQHQRGKNNPQPWIKAVEQGCPLDKGFTQHRLFFAGN